MIGEARAHVADLLAGVGVPVFTYPPATVSLPAVLIVADDPYLTPHTVGGWLIGLAVQVVVSGTGAGSAPAQTLDQLLEAVLAALPAGQVTVRPLPTPRTDTETGQLTADVPITLHWTDD